MISRFEFVFHLWADQKTIYEGTSWKFWCEEQKEFADVHAKVMAIRIHLNQDLPKNLNLYQRSLKLRSSGGVYEKDSKTLEILNHYTGNIRGIVYQDREVTCSMSSFSDTDMQIQVGPTTITMMPVNNLMIKAYMRFLKELDFFEPVDTGNINHFLATHEAQIERMKAEIRSHYPLFTTKFKAIKEGIHATASHLTLFSNPLIKQIFEYDPFLEESEEKKESVKPK